MSMPTLVRLPLVRLTDDVRAVKVAANQFRRHVEKELLAKGGGGVVAGCRVHTATTAYRRHLECERRLHEGRTTLKLDEWLSLADRSVKWLETRDRALAGLGLDVNEKEDPWQSVYNSPPAAVLPPPGPAEAAGQPEGRPDGPDAVDATPDTLPDMSAEGEDAKLAVTATLPDGAAEVPDGESKTAVTAVLPDAEVGG